MKNLKILIVLILYVNFSFSHFEIFRINDGTFDQGNQKLNSNYSFTLNFKERTFIDQIGLDFFDVGNDGKAKIQIKIYQENQLLFNHSNYINDIYGQIAYVDINSLFYENKSYVFNLILIGNDESNKDNFIRNFKPNLIPLDIKENPFITTEINTSLDSIHPFKKSLFCPFVHIGTTNQKGIDFSVIDNKKEFEETNKYVSRSTIFMVEKDITINKIGINYFETGNDNMSNITLKLEDLTETFSIIIDTIIHNHHKKPLSYLKNISLKKNHTYSVSIILKNENNLDDLLVLFKPNEIPYNDNLQKIKIINFYNYNNKDTLGVPFTFEYEDNNYYLNVFNKNINQKEFKINNQLILYDGGKKIKKISLFDLTGKELTNIDVSDINFDNNKVFINTMKMEFNLLQFIFEDLSSSYFILQNQGN